MSSTQRSTVQVMSAFMCYALLFTVMDAFAETMYVKVSSAQIRSGRTSIDPVVAWVRFGEKVNASERQENYVQVQTSNGSQGWIFFSKLSVTQPSGEGDDGLLSKVSTIVRTSPSSTTASGGARGLDKVAESYAKQNNISLQHQEAVDRMTNYAITDQEIDNFMKEGGLGEYSK